MGRAAAPVRPGERMPNVLVQYIVGSGTFCVYLDDFLQINAGKERSVVSSKSTLLTFGILDTLSITDKRKCNILRTLDTWLGSHQWLADNLSVADFALAVTFMTRKDINFDISGWKNVTGWLARVEARPSWQQAGKCW